MLNLLYRWVVPNEFFFLSFFLSLVSKTQPNDFATRCADLTRKEFDPSVKERNNLERRMYVVAHLRACLRDLSDYFLVL
jgi:hypothetical protein